VNLAFGEFRMRNLHSKDWSLVFTVIVCERLRC
jgi:hypothetical protein